MIKKLVFLLSLLMLVACIMPAVSATTYYVANGSMSESSYPGDGDEIAYDLTEGYLWHGRVSLPQTCGSGTFYNLTYPGVWYIGVTANDDYSTGDYLVCLAPPSEGSPPVAAFSGTPTNGTTPLSVSFTDSSTNTPTSWLWDFGDGNSTGNTDQNPVHLYTSGTYNVNLTATNGYGSDYEYKSSYITVSDVTPTTSPTPTPTPTINVFTFESGETIVNHEGASEYPSLTLWANDSLFSGNPTAPAVLKFIDGQVCGSDEFPYGNFSAGTWVEGYYHSTGNYYVCTDTGNYTPQLKKYFTVMSDSLEPGPGYGYGRVFATPKTTYYSVSCIALGTGNFTGETGTWGQTLGEHQTIRFTSGFSDPHDALQIGGIDVMYLTKSAVEIEQGTLDEAGLRMIPTSDENYNVVWGGYQSSAEYDDVFSPALPTTFWPYENYQFGIEGAPGGCIIEWTSADEYFIVDVRDASENITIPRASLSIRDTSLGLTDVVNTINRTYIVHGVLDHAIDVGTEYSITASALNYTSKTESLTYTSAGQYLTIYLGTSGNTTGNATYWYPVTIIDATTGNLISGSWLTSGVDDDYYTRTSSTGIFNVTGKGSTGVTPLQEGDLLTLAGNATGYANNYFSILVSGSNNHIGQVIPLPPLSLEPISEEFTVITNVFDDDTTEGISGATVSITGSGYLQSKSTISGGTTYFTNLTVNQSYTATVTKPGYAQATKIFTTTYSHILYVDIPLSNSPSVTTVPTTPPITTVATITYPTTSANGTYGGFFGPVYDLFSAMGAENREIGVLMAGIFVFAGFIVGGFGPGTIIPNSGFSMSAASAGGILGFTMACAFGFISIVWIVVVILLIVFWAIFLK
jgi:PKD repeat protein